MHLDKSNFLKAKSLKFVDISSNKISFSYFRNKPWRKLQLKIIETEQTTTVQLKHRKQNTTQNSSLTNL
jgi:hypothetical protein